MTKKEYKAIAAALRNVYEANVLPSDNSEHMSDKSLMFANVLTAFCQVMRDDNAKFAADKFIDACYPADMSAALKETVNA